MTTQRILIVVIALFFIRCSGNGQQPVDDGTKLLNYKYFTIRMPKSWKRVDIKTIDSYAGQIFIDSSNAIVFDLGWYANSLDEDKESRDYRIEKGKVFVKDKARSAKERDVSYYIYIGKADSNTLEKVRQSRTESITIDGYKAKLVVAKKPGQGTTGLYIDSLWKAGSDNNRFQINGHDLTAKQQEQLVTAIKTLKFYQHPSK